MRRASGPPMMMHSLPQQLDKVRYVATINVFFLLTNALKLIPHTALGQFSLDNLLLSLALTPSCRGGMERVVAAIAGHHLWFYRIARLGLLLAGS